MLGVSLLKKNNSYYLEEISEHMISRSSLFIITKAILGKEKAIRFRAAGSSMKPFINDKDTITITPVGEKKISIGDVVAFISPQRRYLMVHRVVGKKGKSCIMKGDNGSIMELVSPYHEILGRVSKVERNGKTIRGYKTPEKYIIAFLSRFKILRILGQFRSRYRSILEHQDHAVFIMLLTILFGFT